MPAAVVAPAPKHKDVVRDPVLGDYNAYLWGQFVGGFPSQMAAWTELDRLACQLSEDGTEVDPAKPFAIGALPTSLDVSEEAISTSYTQFCTFFAQSPKIVERAEKALSIAQNRRDMMTIISATEVTVKGSGSKPYRIIMEPFGSTCICKDFRVTSRQLIHSGSCKHIIAVELVRMAQAYEATSADTSASSMVYLVIDAQTLALALGIARVTEQPISVDVTGDRLTITVGERETPIHTISLQGSDGDGCAAVRVAPDAFATLWHTFHPHAAMLDQVNLFLDESELVVAADTFSAVTPGVTIPTQE